MAKPFLENLEILVNRHLPDDPHLVCKHFFSGAALYSSGVMCASLSPVGLAFKLPADVRTELIDCGAASKLKYFAKSPIKKGYVLFSDIDNVSDADIAKYFGIAVAHVRPKKI
jgi:hypothetical protein